MKIPEQVEVHCGLCNRPINSPAELEPETVLSCACGNSDTYENIMEMVREQVMQDTADSIFEDFERSFRNSKIMKIKCDPSPKKRYKFVAVEIR